MKKRIRSLLLSGMLAGTVLISGCGSHTENSAVPSAEADALAVKEITAGDSRADGTALEQTEKEAAGSGSERIVYGEMVDTSAFRKDGPYTIGFSNISVINTYREQMVLELEYASSLQGIELLAADAGGDSAKQVSDIQDLIDRGIDALLVAPGSTTATNEVTKQAIQKGIPVIVFDSEVDDPAAYTSYVGTYAVEFGYVLGKWLLNELDGKGNIIILNGIAGSGLTEKRYEGFEKALSELPDGGKNINILATYYADWAYDKGKQCTKQALAAYPRIDGIWSQGGAMTQGALEAFQEAGRAYCPMTGEDSNGFLKKWEEVKSDGFRSIAASGATWQGTAALEYALKALNGELIEKDHYIPIPIITEESLDEYVKPQYSDSYWCNTKLPEEVAEKMYGSGNE